MDLFLIIFSFIFLLLGITGSFLPILPGPLTGWIGFLLLYQVSCIPSNNSFLWTTLFIAIGVFLIDYIVPIIGTKKFGGTRSGAIGSTIGLVFGLITLGPFGIIIGSFGGAFLGELINNPTRKKAALKAAIGSLVGFISGFLLKLITAIIFLFYYLKILWANVN
tara:strand:+ start:612 stop:1103 length:492 start_codon:yes stop_codon:yes gene_type:complete